jgi:hypothetical protein
VNQGFLILLLWLQSASGPPPNTSPEAAVPIQEAAERIQPGTPAAQPNRVDKRIAGVLPNYRTADGRLPYAPISAKKKLYIGFKDTTDWPLLGVSAFYTGIGQATNSHPYLGQGMAGFGRRYWRNYTDLAVGNLMAESIMPIVLKEDPRYFLDAERGWKTRMKYATTRVLITRTDSGGTRFNYSEFLGNGIAVGLSNLYYADSRTVGDNVTKLLLQIGTDAASNVIKEFWPDVKRWRERRRARSQPQVAQTSPARP